MLRLRMVLSWAPSPVRTPFTFWYLMLLLATTIVLSTVQKSVGKQMLLRSSTDAQNLAHRPLAVLVSSALVLAGGHWLAYVVAFALLIAPLERRIGTGWTFVVFVSGHLIATVCTELPILIAVLAGLLPWHDARWLDVGVSYGLFACAGALVRLIAKPAQWWALAVVYLLVVAASVGSGPLVPLIVTAAGHVIAVHLGLWGWLPFLRARGLVGTVATPTWSWPRRSGENLHP